MLCGIVINVDNSKKPWDDVPIEVLIEDERKRRQERKDHREHLHAPRPFPVEYDNSKAEDRDGYKIVIKF